MVNVSSQFDPSITLLFLVYVLDYVMSLKQFKPIKISAPGNWERRQVVLCIFSPEIKIWAKIEQKIQNLLSKICIIIGYNKVVYFARTQITIIWMYMNKFLTLKKKKKLSFFLNILSFQINIGPILEQLKNQFHTATIFKFFRSFFCIKINE